MAEAVVSFAVETIGTLLIEEAKFLDGVSDQAQQLQLELKQMLSFLRDADAKQHDEETVKEWISQARDLAYAAEDLLESYAFKFAAGRRRGIRSIIKKCACNLNNCYASHTAGADIQTLKAKISDLTKRFQDYGIGAMMEREGGSSSLEQQLRRTYSHVIEDHFVGLESDVELLVEHLVMKNDIRHYRFVSIYGMGGLGKSTLARKVYNHPRVKRYFDGSAWVCVSQKWQKEDVLQRILKSLIPERTEEILKWKDEELVRQLFQIQQSKKFLVVLDDIWSTDAWECITQAFPIRRDGSKILLTTRNKDVAVQIDPNGFHHQPHFLSDDESWELLKMKVSWERCEGGHEDMQKFKNLGKEMVKACGGLPLGVIVLGGTLATKKSLNEWVMVSKNIKVQLGGGNNLIQEQGNVSKILALSYDDLPHKLKPCFLYLAKFDEDSDIDTETLYQLWIAEGLISIKDRVGEESMMDVAERHLGELVQRCMVQGKAPEIPSMSIISFASCRLHDLMRELSLRKAKEENFLLSINYDDGFDDDIANNYSLTHPEVHRLVISLSEKSVSKYVPLEKRITRHLRSLDITVSDLYEGRMAQTMKSQFNQFKMLRVLAIEGLSPADFADTCKEVFHYLVDHLKLPKAIGNLIHLRYLSLRRSLFAFLPSSIGNLQHLQALDLRDAKVIRIPNVLWKMRQLRHLYLPHEYNIVDLGKLNTFFCKLRLDGLNKLEILENIIIPVCSLKEISKLKRLRALSFKIDVDLADPTEIIEYFSNSDPRHLRRTSLLILAEGNSMKLPNTVVAQCFSCCNLQKLELIGPIDNLPRYEAHSGLIELTLSGSRLREDPMETLQMLPNLRILVLILNAFVGKEMRCNGSGFRQLKFLSLKGLSNLENWWVDEGAMPNLSVMEIVYCKKLEMIPIGLRFITTLQELNIINMPNEFTDRIQEVDGRKGADFDKVSHIPSVIIRDYLDSDDLEIRNKLYFLS